MPVQKKKVSCRPEIISTGILPAAAAGENFRALSTH